eukprot:180275-Chlamydomonas_euryale.AAC.1
MRCMRAPRCAAPPAARCWPPARRAPAARRASRRPTGSSAARTSAPGTWAAGWCRTEGATARGVATRA